MAGDFGEARVDGQFDWAFESGVFNYKVSDHEAWVRDMIRKMLRHVSWGVAVDFLNDRGGFLSNGLYHPDPIDVYRMCCRLSRRVILRCDYKPTEFCVYLYKDTKAGAGNVFRGYEAALGDILKRPGGRGP